MTKQLLIKLPIVSLVLTLLVSMAHGGIPSIDVTVFDAAEKVVFKRSINANVTFETGSFRTGNYVVQFNTRSPAMKNNHYLAVISAGKKKVIADAVAGEQFAGGGVAMKVQVESGLRITGQVANEASTLAKGDTKVRIVNGQRYVWVPSRLGTNLGPHWEPEGVANGNNLSFLSIETMRRIQDHSFEGSMLDRYNTGHPTEVAVHSEGY